MDLQILSDYPLPCFFLSFQPQIVARWTPVYHMLWNKSNRPPGTWHIPVFIVPLAASFSGSNASGSVPTCGKMYYWNQVGPVVTVDGMEDCHRRLSWQSTGANCYTLMFPPGSPSSAASKSLWPSSGFVLPPLFWNSHRQASAFSSGSSHFPHKPSVPADSGPHGNS